MPGLNTIKHLSTLICITALPAFLSHCAHKPIPEPTADNPLILKTVDTTHVTAVVLTGHMHVNLNTQLNHPHLSFEIPKNDIDNTNINIKNNTLYINNTNDRDLPTTYQLTLGTQLNALSLYGNVSVDAHRLDANQLTIVDASAGKVKLNGQIDIQRIDANKNSQLSIAWVDSPQLVVYANEQAHVNLAGVAKEFYIHLAGNALLNAQYLRANSTTISSNDASQADLMPLFSFQGFAHQNSTIYLYHQPEHQNIHTWDMANIFMKSYRP